MQNTNREVKVYRKVIRKPDFLHRWTGRRHARISERLVETTISRMVNAEAALEFRLVQETEQTLQPVRTEAARKLSTLNSRVVPFPGAGGPSAADVRARRTAAAAGKHALEFIIQAGEQITNAHALLEDEIEHARARLNDKVHAYVLGVRKRLPEYAYGELFAPSSAYETYLRQHEELDREIHTAAKNAWKQNTTNHEEA